MPASKNSTGGDKPAQLRMPRLSAVRLIGFASLQCWMLVIFSSPILYMDSPSMPVPMLHIVSSLFSVGTSVVILLACGTNGILKKSVVPLCRQREVCFVMCIAGMGGTLFAILASGGFISLPWGAIGFAFMAISLTWFELSWQELFSTLGARDALLEMAISTVIGALLFFVLSFVSNRAAAFASALLPLASQLCMRPRSKSAFFANVKEGIRTSELCSLIAYDYSPRVMSICALTAFAYSGVRSTAMPLIDPSSMGAWFESAAALSFSALIACVAIMGVRRRGLVYALYAALPIGAVGIMVASPSFGGHSMAALMLATICYTIANYVVWVFMIERSFKKKLPVLGLFASLWCACFTGMVVGQMLSVIWPGDFTQLSYIYLVALLAAALLMVGIGDKLTVSEAVLAAPPEDDRSVRAMKLAEECGLSPRETEIFLIWVSGHNSEYIEETLHISRNTVKTHLTHIYQKTGTSGREGLLQKIDQS